MRAMNPFAMNSLQFFVFSSMSVVVALIWRGIVRHVMSTGAEIEIGDDGKLTASKSMKIVHVIALAPLAFVVLLGLVRLAVLFSDSNPLDVTPLLIALALLWALRRPTTD